MDDDEGRQAWSRARGRGGAAARRGRRAQASADGSGRAAGLRRTLARAEARRRAARAAAELMNPEALAVLIPVVLFGGFFAWMIARTVSKAYTARLQAHSPAAPGSETRQEELLAAVDELRREVAELAERVDFTERLLAKARDGEAGKLPPGGRRTGST